MIARITAWAVLLAGATAWPCGAQSFSQRGFVESRVLLYPQDTFNDSANVVADVLAREEVSVKVTSWLQFAGAADFRADSHDQVDTSWTLDFFDRGLRRPTVSIRRVNATLSRGRLTVDAGKQFMRWGKTDIVTPTDRFAPRDFLNVIYSEFLPVTGVRVDGQLAEHTLEGIWVPVLTPSRVPLLDQRWSGIPELPDGVSLVQSGAAFQDRDQFGVRWSWAGSGYEASLAYFDGLNHLPDVAASLSEASDLVIQPRYPRLRMYGGDAALPMPWVTVKAEVAYMTAPDDDSDEFVLYAVQAERQQGEWQFIGGYVGDISTVTRIVASFSPERGLAKSIVGRASYTIDTNRSAAAEALVRQNGDAFYCKGEYSWARGQHWRTTISAALIRGEPDDFLGQYDRNSHFNLTLRYSF